MDPHTRESLRAQLGEPGTPAQFKAISELDQNCADILALSPFAVVATAGADGSCDASPRGGPPGFIRVLSSTRVALGELPGNRLFDGAQNLVENPSAALLVMIPGMNETLRIEGHAVISTDANIRRTTAVDDKVPWGALVIDVVKVFTHCGKAFKRSRLWEPESWPAVQERPRMGAVIAAHMAAPGPDGCTQPPDVDAVEKGLNE
ncbi:MAG: MSMEG_1061 family FMN-dependent PPOX-type flavoprotein [Allobranchiibius sp.]